MSEKAYPLGSHEDENGQDALEDAESSTATAGQNDEVSDTKKKHTLVPSDNNNEQTELKNGNSDAGKNGKKRGADQLTGTEDESNKRAKDGQKTSSKALNVPVDEGFLNEGPYFPRKAMTSVFWRLLTRYRPKGLH